MKKLLSIVLILIICLSICACGKTERVYESVIPGEPATYEDAENIDFSGAVTIVSSPTPVPTTEVVFTPEPTPAVTSAPIPTPTPTAKVVVPQTGIVKNPTGETVSAGGTAKFICYTNSSNAATWIIKGPGEIYGVDASQAPNTYAGLQVSGQGTSTLVLSNIPLSMNGCKIQAHFGEDYSANALLTVTSSGPVTPTDANSAIVKQDADNCLAEYAKRAQEKSYSSSALQNYKYTAQTETAGSKADYNITFTNGTYVVIGEFTSVLNGNLIAHYPVYAVAYSGNTPVGQKSFDLSSGDLAGQFSAFLANPVSNVEEQND